MEKRYPEGTYIGELRGETKHGIGKFTYSVAGWKKFTGNAFKSIPFINKLLDNKEVTYVGQYRNNEYHGVGKITWSNGDYFMENFIFGKP